jgi:hypothetical protein
MAAKHCWCPQEGDSANNEQLERKTREEMANSGRFPADISQVQAEAWCPENIQP